MNLILRHTTSVLVTTLLCVWPCVTQSADYVQPSNQSNSGKSPFISSSSMQKNAFSQILQTVIDLPALQKYYHANELSDRKPLFILKNNLLNEESHLSKFGERVTFASCENLTKTGKPFLEFTKLDISNNKAEVIFRYRVEGLEGRLSIDKEGGNWRVLKQELVEAKFSDKGCE